jgi:hypothetical protein
MCCRNEKQLVTADQDMLSLLNRIALYKHRSTLVFEVGSTSIMTIATLIKTPHEVTACIRAQTMSWGILQ